MKNPLELWIAIPDSAISDEQTKERQKHQNLPIC